MYCTPVPAQLVHILADKRGHTGWRTRLPDTLQSAKHCVCVGLALGLGVRAHMCACMCACVCVKTWPAANNIDFHFIPLCGFLSLSLPLPPSLCVCVCLTHCVSHLNSVSQSLAPKFPSSLYFFSIKMCSLHFLSVSLPSQSPTPLRFSSCLQLIESRLTQYQQAQICTKKK